MALAHGTSQVGGTSIKKVALATLIGTATEWYDYFLYGEIVKTCG